MIRTRRLTHIQRKGIVNAGLLIGTLVCIPAADAQESAPTPPVVGHKPVAENVRIDQPAPKLGDTLSVLYEYQDADNDAEGASIIKWRYNGTEIAGETERDYTPKIDVDTGKPCTISVTAEVTPVSLTGDPLVGDARESTAVEVALPTIPGFTSPDNKLRLWDAADAACRAQEMRLPTRAELIELFNTYTTGEVENYQLSENYGWPIKDKCGSGSWTYWTNEARPAGGYYSVYMNRGDVFDIDDDLPRYSTCVK